MIATPSFLRRLAACLLMGLLTGLLAACGTTAPPAPPKTLLEQDVNTAVEQLLENWRAQRSTPMLFARLAPQSLALGAFAELPPTAVPSGFALPQSQAASKARGFVSQRLAAEPDLRVVPAEAAARGEAQLLVDGQLAPQLQPNARRRLTLVLLDAKSGEVLARAQGDLRSTAADAFPTAFDADSPVLVNESVASSKAGADSMAAMAAAAVLAQGQDAYVAGDYRGALALFERAGTMPSANPVRVYNGLYLSRLKLGQQVEAMEAFKRLVAEGLAARALGIKLLFVPGQTEFLEDAEVRAAYAGWLQVIAAQAAAATSCLNVVGHTSHTGEETYNLELSKARSERVRGLLKAEQPALGERISVTGKGWTENIVGSGTDDARDAVDRRVEFRVVDCAG